MPKDGNPFSFYTSSNLIELTGEKATTLEELLSILKQCSGSAIFYHVFQSFRDRHFAIEKYHSDFAQWISNSLDEEMLAEKMAALDVRDFTSIRAFRESMIQVIADHLRTHPASRERQGKTPFFLSQSITVAIPTPYVVRNLEEFCQAMEKVTTSSIHYHLVEARLRLELHTNDFSYWFRTSLNKEDLAKKIEGIDIYLNTLEELRALIIRRVQEEMKP